MRINKTINPQWWKEDQTLLEEMSTIHDFKISKTILNLTTNQNKTEGKMTGILLDRPIILKVIQTIRKVNQTNMIDLHKIRPLTL